MKEKIPILTDITDLEYMFACEINTNFHVHVIAGSANKNASHRTKLMVSSQVK